VEHHQQPVVDAIVAEAVANPIPPEGRIAPLTPESAEEAVRRALGGAMVPVAGAADPDRVLEIVRLLKARVAAWKQVRAAALSHLNHNDIVNMEDDTNAEPVPYIQGHGCVKLFHMFGIEIDGGRDVQFRLVHLEDGTYMYVRETRARCLALSDIWVDIVGSRWSGDGFFQHPDKENPGHFKPIDPGDVLKSALTNLWGEALRAVLGLGSLTRAELEEAGIDWSKVKSVGYASTRKPVATVDREHNTNLTTAGKPGGTPFEVLEVSESQGTGKGGKTFIRVVATLMGPKGKVKASCFDSAIGDVLSNAQTLGVQCNVLLQQSGEYTNILGATIPQQAGPPNGGGE
jgi:hypothetical protein